MSQVVNLTARGNVLQLTKERSVIDMISGTGHHCSLGHDFGFPHPTTLHSSCGFRTRQQSQAEEALGKLNSEYDWQIFQSQEAAIESAILCAIGRRIEKNGSCARKILVLPDTFAGNSMGTGHFHNEWLNVRRPYDIVELPLEVLEGEEIPEKYLLDFDAVFVEPVQLRTGFALGYPSLFKLKRWCEQIDASLIVNECYTGLSRCAVPGFISGYSSIADIVVLGSSIAQGFPSAALGFRKSLFGEEEFNFRHPMYGAQEAIPSICEFIASVVSLFIRQSTDFSTRAQSLENAFVEAFRNVSHINFRSSGAMNYIHFFSPILAQRAQEALLFQHRFLVARQGPWIIAIPSLMTPFYLVEQLTSAILKEHKSCLDQVLNISLLESHTNLQSKSSNWLK